jgi:uncharacterized lipoprotein YmbA
MNALSRPLHLVLTSLLIIGLGACASAATPRFYTLVRPAVPAVANATPLLIEVLPVTVPMQVDVQELVIRQGAGSVARAESRRWIAPLGEEIRDALSAGLRQQLGARDLYRLPRAAVETPVRRIKVDVRRFDSYLGHQALIEAAWTISAAQPDAAAVTCDSRIAEAVSGSDYDALVQAHQRALAVLTTQIASALTTTAVSPACPR